MQRLLIAEQMRALEAAAGERFGLPSSLLMELAGEALANVAVTEARDEGCFLVLCGRGNNGGDGLVAARKLAARGRRVQVEIVGGAAGLQGEPARNLSALAAEGIQAGQIRVALGARHGDVVIDALLGTGLNRAPEGGYAEAIGRIAAWQAAGARVVSADLPSGVDADRGRLFDPSVAADVTVAFGHLKIAHAQEPGVSRCGRVVCAPIGLPNEDAVLIDGPRAFLLEEADVRRRLSRRAANSHKGTFGHVLVIAGSRGKTGAAALASMAALRAGAGLVTVATRSDCLDAVLAHAPELMGVSLQRQGPLLTADLEDVLAAAEGKSAIVLGPGIPRSEGTLEFVSELVRAVSVPCVLDADALNAVGTRGEVFTSARAPLLLTPHPGEMARLAGKTTAEVQSDRIELARRFAVRTGVTLILKGSHTVIAMRDGTTWVNPTGNAGMATGGTGDVLSGILGGLLAQGLAPADAALVGPYVHGLAGDGAARARGERGLIASDLLKALGAVWSRWGQ